MIFRRSVSHLLWAVSLLVASAQVVASDLPSELPAGLQRCREEQDDAKRLDCFDRESARLANANKEQGLATETVPRTAEQRFGFRGDIARSSIDDRRRAEPVLEKLQAKVTAIRFGPTGNWVVTLDNGQEWAQVALGVRVSLKPGDPVTIMPLSLGSFALVAQSGQSTRVRRRL